MRIGMHIVRSRARQGVRPRLMAAASAFSRARSPVWADASPLSTLWSLQTQSFGTRVAASPPSSPQDQWLKNPRHPVLQHVLKLEKAHLSQILSRAEFRRVERAFYSEFRQRVVRAHESIPERIGSYEYSMRQAPRENYPVYYRKHLATQREEIVLNQNVDHALDAFPFVMGMKISPDEMQLLVVMENEHEQCVAMHKRIGSNKWTPLANLPPLRNVEWAGSSDAFYFTKVDAHRRPYAVSRYDLRTKAQRQLYEEADPAFFVDVSQTKDGNYVLINCNSKNTSEIHALASHNPDAAPQLLRAREEGTAYFADHAADTFFIVTNANQAANYKIMSTASPAHPWEVLLPEAGDVKIEDVDLFQDFFVIYERVSSVPRIRISKLSDPHVDFHYVSLPEQHAICRITPGVNRDYRSHRVRFSITTPLVPEIVYDYDMQAKELHILKESTIDVQQKSKQQSGGGSKQRKSQRSASSTSSVSPFRSEDFTCQRLLVPSTTSEDTRVPLTLIHHRDLKLNGQNPTLMLGYGAYGTNLEADFEVDHLSLLERGWVIALAHVRGGGELGLRWYHDGKGLQKRHSFDDFLACTQYLLDQQYTNPTKLAAKGVSAGGLIMGYMANEHPSLFQALIMKVPFVDILETMQDPSLPLTVHEYDEWGNPTDPEVYEYIKSYAPCENIREDQVYPAMFVTGSMNDQRVQFWEPVKWVYRLRQLQVKQQKQQRNLLLLKMSEDDGHFGGGGRLEQMQESAMEIAFLYQALKLPLP